MSQFKVTLYWDAVPIASQFISDEGQGLDLAKWNHISWRLDVPLEVEWERMWNGQSTVMFPLHQSTYLRIDVERVDSRGRRLTR